jgi:hypothetical protein
MLFVILITSACVIVIVAYFAINPSYRASVLFELGVNSFTAKNLDPVRFSSENISREDYNPADVQTVYPDYSAVSHWVLNCLGVDPENPNRAIAVVLIPDRLKVGGQAEWPKDIRHFDADEMLIIELNKRLTDQRLNLMGKVRSSYFFGRLQRLRQS